MFFELSSLLSSIMQTFWLQAIRFLTLLPCEGFKNLDRHVEIGHQAIPWICFHEIGHLLISCAKRYCGWL